MKETKKRVESRMTKGRLDDQKKLVSIEGVRVVPSSYKGDLVSLSGKTGNVAAKDLASKLVNDVKGVKSVMNQITIGESKETLDRCRPARGAQAGSRDAN